MRESSAIESEGHYQRLNSIPNILFCHTGIRVNTIRVLLYQARKGPINAIYGVGGGGGGGGGVFVHEIGPKSPCTKGEWKKINPNQEKKTSS